MRFPLLSLLSVLLLLTALPSAQAGQKGPAAYIGLHPEGAEDEGKRMVVPNRLGEETYFFRISPEISIRHFAAYTPVPADDGSWGVSLLLTEEGRRAVQVMCTTYGGKLARVIVNGRAIDTMRIDRPGDDGRIILWRGLTKQDLLLIDKKLKRQGGDDPKKL